MTSRAFLVLTALAALAAIGGPRAEVEALTLYQKTGRATLVVRARALSASTRRPQVLVIETIKGNYPERTNLTVVPHFEDRGNPTPWLKREVFRTGEESLLFLQPYVDDFGRPGHADTWEVLGANHGKLDIPPEGADALLDAVRRFASVLALGQMEAQSEALRGMLREKNPYLLEAALLECRRFALARAEDSQSLVPLFEHPRPDLRRGALDVLVQILKTDGAQSETGESYRPRLFEAVAGRARMDEDASVREGAVAALEAFGDRTALSVLDSMGTADTSQQVRYQALVAARRLRAILEDRAD
ncbi:MAG: HEAT repeat domain-containing protein [Candidatus Polarisedimenticolia bacterium]